MSMRLLSREAREQRKYRNTLLGLVGITLLLLVAPGSRLLIPLLPAMSLGLALYFIPRSRRHYVTLICWLFFVTPLVRRLVEFRMGSPTASYIMTAPLLASIAGITGFRSRWSTLFTAKLHPWIYAAGAVAYGTVVGLLFHSAVGVLPDLLGWLSPLGFSLYLLSQREHLREIMSSLQANFIYGVTIMGLYGLYQFFFMTPWDAFWMENSALNSIGLPLPMQVRVFSTMNTPQPFADFVLYGMFFAAMSKHRLRFVAVPVGLLTLGLSMSRSAWVGGAAGLLYLSFAMTGRQRMQLATLVIACVGVLGLATMVPEVDDLLTSRVQTLNNLKEDGSVNDRVASQQQAIALLKDSPYGLGLGAGLDASSKADGPSYGVARTDVNLSDDGLEEVLLSFGWFGSLVFFGGFATAVFSCFRAAQSAELRVLKAGLIAMLTQIPVLGIFLAASGFLVWSSVALCIASRPFGFEERAAEPLRQVDWNASPVDVTQ